MIKKTILLVIVVLSLNGCTKDDICPGETQTTPLLIITFKNILNPLLAKTATKLTIETDEATPNVLVTNISTDSIGIPLRTGADTVRYRFIKNSGEPNEVVDIYEFRYERLDTYVNRACGFKTTYQELHFTVSSQYWPRCCDLLATVAPQCHLTLDSASFAPLTLSRCFKASDYGLCTYFERPEPEPAGF